MGSILSRFLLEHDDTVRVVAVGRNPERTASLAVHTGVADRKYEYHRLHVVSDVQRLVDLLWDVMPEVIVNVAAQGEEAASWSHSWRYFETNTVAIARIVESLLASPWRGRWVQIGSASVYGSGQIASTEESPLRAATPYAASKAAADLYLLAVHAMKQFSATIVRPPSLYGPGQQTYRVIPRTILCALQGTRLPLHGGGEAKKFYLHASDLCRAIYSVAQRGADGRIYNVGPEAGGTIRDVVEMIAQKVGVPFDRLVDLAPARGKQDTQASLDSSRIRSELGWEPKVGLSEGLDEMINWMKPRLELLRLEPVEFRLQV